MNSKFATLRCLRLSTAPAQNLIVARSRTEDFVIPPRVAEPWFCLDQSAIRAAVVAQLSCHFVGVVNEV